MVSNKESSFQRFQIFQSTVGIFYVWILLIVCLQEVSVAYGIPHAEACDPISANICEDPNAACTRIPASGGYRCLCTSDYYISADNKTCNHLDDLKVWNIQAPERFTNSMTLTWSAFTRGLSVSYTIQPSGGIPPVSDITGNTSQVKGLTPGTQYTFIITSILINETVYYPEKSVNSTTSSGFWTKIPHAEACDPIIPANNICEDHNTACISALGGYRCLCTSDYYRSADNTTCNLLNGLKVSNIRATERLTNNMTLTWSADTRGTSVSYTIQPSDSRPPVSGIRGNTKTVSGLTPGAYYYFTINSVLPATGYYPEKSVNSTTSSTFWTIPAKPGAVADIYLAHEDPIAYDITFEASQGQVSNYTMRVNSETVQTSGPATTVTFTTLIPGQSYNYSLTAYNGNIDASEPYTGTLKTPVIASGPVSELMVSDITSDRAKVTWKKPYRPNGEITGYTLKVNDESVCLYGHIINCSDCSKPGPSGNISSCHKSASVFKTSAALNDDTTTFTVEVSALEPYRNYTVRVTADNFEGIGIVNTILFRTSVAAARNVTNVSATSTRNSATDLVSLTVTWTPGYFTGPTHYLVTLEEEISLGSNSFAPVTVETVTGYDNSELTKTDVLAYWNYRVFVLAMTVAGNSSVVGSSLIQTTTNTPGLPHDFTVLQDETVAPELTLTITCPEEKERNGIITGYVIRKTLLNATGGVIQGNEYTVTADLSQTCSNTYTAKDVDGITVERNYTFGVKVKNTDYIGTYSREVILYVEPKAPRFEEILQSHGISSLVRKQEGSSIQQTAIDVSVCTSCLLDSRQGTVTQVGLLVCQVGTDGNCIDAERKRRSLVNFEDYTTWSRTRAQGFTAPYRATPDDWMSTLTDPHTSYPYRIGADTNCQTTVVNTVYCNGPLPTDTRFRVAVIQCNSVGCVMGTFEGPFRTGDDDSENTTLPIVLGVVIPVVIIIAIIIIIVIVIKRRGSEQHKKEGDQRPYNTMNTAMNDAHLYHGVAGRTYVSPPHTNHDGQDNIAMAGLQTHQASLYQRDVTEYTEPDHYDYIGDNGRQNPENQASQSRDRVGQTGEGEQNRINPYNNLTPPVNAQGKKDYYNM